MRKLWLIGVLLVGCAAEQQSTRGEAGGAQGGTAGSTAPTVTAEQNDGIDALFRRKAPALQRCWQEEYARTQNRKLEGDITLQMLISRGGKAGQIKVASSTIGVEAVDKCVVDEVATWSFPEGAADAPYRRTVHLGPAF